MIKLHRRAWKSARKPQRLTATLAAVATGFVLAAVASAQSQPPKGGPPPPAASTGPPGYPGIWYDDTGKGAVEIVPCADRLCGKIVWLKDTRDEAGKPLIDDLNPDPKRKRRPICGLEVIGDLKRQRDGSWDEGWIYDPKQGKQFDVELKLRAADTLQVMGYLGVKFLSETFIWKRAPADLKRC